MGRGMEIVDEEWPSEMEDPFASIRMVRTENTYYGAVQSHAMSHQTCIFLPITKTSTLSENPTCTYSSKADESTTMRIATLSWGLEERTLLLCSR